MSDVTDNKTQSRYELQAGDHLAVADYRLEGQKLAITHVFVPPELRGGGVAAKLMAGVVEDAKAQKLEIIPICGYAAAYMKRNA